MAEAQTKVVPGGKISAVSQGTDFVQRESAELMVGISGAVGSGTEFAVASLRRVLEERGYSVVHLKISKFLDGLLAKNLVPNWKPEFNDRSRYERLQLAGNCLREDQSTDFLADLAMAVISQQRILRAEKAKQKFQSISDIVPDRTVYIIDQLKHPDEIRALRRIYGNLFYLVGVLASEQQRIKNLRRTMDATEATRVTERDRQDDDTHGQQLDKTLKLADFFLRNNQQNDKSLDKPLLRFMALVHGETSRTPTKDEYAMYAAFSAGLRSACLSRQVGASITDTYGNVIATGCNDVPKAGGALYTEDDNEDHRCIYLEGGICFNDNKKDDLEVRIRQILETAGVGADTSAKVANKIRYKTVLKDLLEFSRSVHAEMDALISVARKGGPSVHRGNLYTTTYPCHNCARHIVAAGISKVFYIEPYEKSLALELHSDAIVTDSGPDDDKYVRFLHFEGVAPRQYTNFFMAVKDRKDKGKAVRTKATEARKSHVEYLDSYRDLESKVVDNLTLQGLSAVQLVELSDPVVTP